MSTLVIHNEDRRVAWLSFGRLAGFQDQEQPTGERFGGLPFRAVRLGAIFARLELCDSFVTVHSEDGYSLCLPWSRISEGAIIYRLGALPLPRRFGGPFRLIIENDPHSSLKLVDVITVTSQPGLQLLPTCSHLAASAEALALR
jgi:hypothetical protein